MIENPMDVLSLFPVRKNKKQKADFRDAVCSYAVKLGYQVKVEDKGRGGAKNVVIGNPETAMYLVTAHYDTPAGMIISNLITPCNFWTFIAYQLLVTGLLFAVAMVPAFVLSELGFPGDLLPTVSVIGLYFVLGMMMFGPANPHNANDNTSGVVTVLDTAANMPDEYRDQVCFVLFDLEEAGLIGSSLYAKMHKKEIKNQLVLNCDCCGDGDELMMFPKRKVKKNSRMLESLRGICGAGERKSIVIREKGFAYYPSDQMNFPYGVGIAAFRRSKWASLYCDKIHTKKDTVLEEENVSFLRGRLIDLISSAAE